MKLRLRSDLPNGGERRVGERLGETGILRNICIYIYIYSVCFFFIELKLFVNLTNKALVYYTSLVSVVD